MPWSKKRTRELLQKLQETCNKKPPIEVGDKEYLLVLIIAQLELSLHIWKLLFSCLTVKYSGNLDL